jgi:hypothetical protein
MAIVRSMNIRIENGFVWVDSARTERGYLNMKTGHWVRSSAFRPRDPAGRLPFWQMASFARFFDDRQPALIRVIGPRRLIRDAPQSCSAPRINMHSFNHQSSRARSPDAISETELPKHDHFFN